jgi:hypothetical protein
MKCLLHILCIAILFLLLPHPNFAQPAPQPTKADTATMSPSKTTTNNDDDFSVFLIAYAIGFVSVIAAASLVGTIIFALVLLALFGLISAGIISTGLLVGIRKRSIAAGFKTAFVIFTSLVGTLAGSMALWLVNHFFHLHWQPVNAALIGALAGLVGGLLLGIILISFLRFFLEYCQRKLSF